MTKQSPPPRSELDRRADALVKRHPSLSDWAEYYRKIAPLQAKAETEVAALELPAQYLRDKLIAGRLMLEEENLPLDTDALQSLLIDLCDCAAPRPPSRLLSMIRRPSSEPAPAASPLAHTAQSLRTALNKKDGLDIKALISPILFAHPVAMNDFAESLKVQAWPLIRLVEGILEPSFRAWAAQLRLPFDEWQRGQCPVCGRLPLFSEIAGKEGERHLRCGMCGTGWAFPRMQCRQCANANHRSLGRITVDGEEEKYFVQTCDLCKGYDKFINNADEIAAQLLHIEDMISGHYDTAARQGGFERARHPSRAGAQ